MKTEAIVIEKIREATEKLSKNKDLLVSPPMPAFHEHTNRGYSWQIIVRSKSRKALVDVSKDLGPNFRITFDPLGLL